MANQINRGNLVTVKISSPNNQTLRTLGFTQEQVDTTERLYKKPVPGDQNGGSDGPPIDVQYMGETVDIRLQLSKYDPDVAAEIESGLGDGKTPGVTTQADVGTLLQQDESYFRVALDCANMPRNFPLCEVIDAIEVNRGTKYATFSCVLKAHRDLTTDIVWNEDVS